MSSIVSFLRWVAEHDASGWIVAAALGLYLLYYIARNTIRDNARDHGEIRKSLARKIRGVFRFRYRHKSPRVVQVQY